MNDDGLVDEFVSEAGSLFADADEQLARIGDQLAAIADQWTAIMRGLHRLKGACGMMRYSDAEAAVQELEAEALRARERTDGAVVVALRDDLDAVREMLIANTGVASGPSRAGDGPIELGRALAQGAHISVRAAELDRMLDSVGDLAAQQAVAAHIVDVMATRYPAADGEGVAVIEALSALGKGIADMRARVMDTRLVTWAPIIKRLERVVSDLAPTLGKRIDVRVSGATTAVDKSLVDSLSEPLLHMVRNAVGHGVESCTARRAQGKPETGVIAIAVQARGDMLEVTLADDGAGIAAASLVERAGALGIDVADLDARGLLDLVFHPYLSTAREVSALSGRGMGLHAARAAVHESGGVIEAASHPGRGTEFRIRVPLAVMMRQVLLVEAAREVYALPLSAVDQVVRLDDGTVRGGIASHRGRRFPITELAQRVTARAPGVRAARPLCVILGGSDDSYGVLIDGLLGQRRVIMRKLDPVLGRPAGVFGIAPLADGQLVMVLDPRWLRPGDGRSRSGAEARG